MTVAVGGLVIALLATGCGPDPRELQIQSLQADLDNLQRENDDLRARLAQAVSERDAAIARGGGLMQQVRELEAALAAAELAEQALPPGWERGAGGTAWIDVGDRILFKQGYADLLPEGRAQLQRIVSDIQTSFSDKLIVVIGHTDSVWTGIKGHVYQDNLALSATRGAAVFRELMRLGLKPQHMIAAGQGEYAPKVPNTSAANMQINRRVQILAIPMPEPVTVGVMTPATGTPSMTRSATPTETQTPELIEK
ncbi:MAG: OmpA family protein [Phycisphaerae bacterium]|nr:OmpA family protein [Phycisphaerae bacterium]